MKLFNLLCFQALVLINVFSEGSAQSCVNYLTELACQAGAANLCEWIEDNSGTGQCVCKSSVGIDVAFVMDESGSVGPDDFAVQLEFVGQLIETALTDRDQVALITFGTSYDIEHSFAASQDRADILDSLNSIIYNGGWTNMGGGIQSAIDEFDNDIDSTNEHVIFVISDGRPNRGVEPCDLRPTLDAINATVILIAVGDWDSTLVECLVDDTASQIIEVDGFQLSDLNDIRDLTDAFLCAAGSGCQVYDRVCKIYGDPHYETFDGLYYHYQGGGAYFDVVKPCDGDTNTLPFQIAALQNSNCLASGDYTCVDEVVVFFPVLDRTIIFPKTGSPYFYAPGDATPTLVPTETFSGTYGAGLSIEYTAGTFSLDIAFEDSSDNEIKYLSLIYKDTTLMISTTSSTDTHSCLETSPPKLCGLCGTFDGNPDNDFTKCINPDNDPPLSIEGVALIRGMSEEAWDATHEFGDSCCSSTITSFFDPDNDCVETPSSSRRRLAFETDLDTVRPPDSSCLDAANALCREAWRTDCKTCGNAESITREKFIEDCEMDVCAAASNDLSGCDTYSCALSSGYLDSSLSLCEIDCVASMHGFVKNDPHFETFNGKDFLFQGDTSKLESRGWDYMVPCKDSYLQDKMPVKVLGKHIRLHPHVKRNHESGVEYIMVELYDYGAGKAYIVWISSIIHSWMEVDYDDAVEQSATFMYHDNVERAIRLKNYEKISLGSRFEVKFAKYHPNEAKLDVTIDGRCEMPVYVKYQNVEVDGRHAVHKVDFDLSPCYECYTCGLMGNHLCDNEDYQQVM